MSHPKNKINAQAPFHVMTKPIGPLCNLGCQYCFYLEKEKLFPAQENYRMSDEVLETYIRTYIQSQKTPAVQFAWQGGEPTLMGLSFFRKVVILQQKYAGGRDIHNAFQTNGTLLDDAWCAFFATEKFLVGLSLDGPEHIHNRYRIDKKGAGSHRHVMAGLQCLKKWRVEFNTLTCVTRQSPEEALEIYRFLKQQGVEFMQFIPVVERKGDRVSHSIGLDLATPPHPAHAKSSGTMMPWAVSSIGFGDFLISIFDEWVKNDVGHVFVNLFDAALGAWCGMEPSLCIFSRQCGQAVAMEHDGSIYSCDHYVYPSYFLGNIMDQSWEEMLESPAQKKFGHDKSDTLPQECRECDFLFACNGECPKHRFLQTAAGEPDLNYLCAGYKKFFTHIHPQLCKMRALLQQGRTAADIMPTRHTVPGKPRVSRNDPCPCGSRIKFKKCCGA